MGVEKECTEANFTSPKLFDFIYKGGSDTVSIGQFTSKFPLTQSAWVKGFDFRSSGLAKNGPNLVLTTKMVFPKTRKVHGLRK